MRTQRNDISLEKSNGRFYTPTYIVQNILDMSGYYGGKIIKKHVIDNSCGDGAFLLEIVKRYCESAIAVGLSKEEIAIDLGIYIHGIEIDKNEHAKCVGNIGNLLHGYGFKNVVLDIKCADAMKVEEYNGKMDFVLGNPPYVRVHNVGDSFDKVKQFSFAQNGMTDFYIVFYEIGLKMLNVNGVLGYITPSSYFNSIAGEYMRKYLITNNLIDKIVDLKHYQAFNATTYTAITILKKCRAKSSIDYYQFDEENKIPYYVDTLNVLDFCINNNFYFAHKEKLSLLRQIFGNLSHSDVSVKNGYATLCDDVFIADFNFKSKYIIPIVKASTGKLKQIIYPYGENSKLIPETKMREDSAVYRYLLENKNILTKRSNEKNDGSHWYAFGRSQAINDTYKNKISISTLLRSTDDIKIVSAPAGVGVYSGLYIVSETIDIDLIKKVILSEDFITYVSLLGKYKSGGYYTFSSKDLKAYLDFKLLNNAGIAV